MRFLNKTAFSVLILSIVVLTGCGGGRTGGTTYDQEISGAMSRYRVLQFRTAANMMAGITSRIMKNLPVDRYIAFLEFGKMSLAARNYALAIKYMSIARRRFLNIEGTISISEETSSIFLDDTSKEYEAEPHEKIMIAPYLALAYAAKGDYSGANVERNKVINRIAEYIERTRKRWLENSFARYLSAVLYEKQDKIQDAKLEYRKILSSSRYKGDAAASLALVGKNRQGENGQLVCFIDLGLSPVKRQRIYDKSIYTSKGPVRVRYAYAVMVPSRYNRVKYARVLVDGKAVGTSSLLYNVEQVVMKQFRKNLPKIKEAITKRVLPRVMTQVVGQSLATSRGPGWLRAIGAVAAAGAKIGMAIERADTRSWLTLPRTIHSFRSRDIPKGIHTVKIEYLNRAGDVIGNSAERKINIKRAGDLEVLHFAVPY